MEPRGESLVALLHNYWGQCYRTEPRRSNGLISELENQDSWSANLACDAPSVFSNVLVSEFITE
jgi:hypothetical protein